MAPNLLLWRRFAFTSAYLLAFTGLCGPAWAQDTPEAPAPDAPAPESPATLEALQERLAELETRLAEVEKPTPAAEEEAEEPESAGVFSNLPYGTKVKIGGAVRVRGEYRTPKNHLPAVRTAAGVKAGPTYTVSEKDTAFTLLRTRINLDVQTLNHVRAFVELQDSRTFGDTGVNTLIGEGSTTGAGDFAVHIRQSFLEVNNLLDGALKARVGRFALPDLGDARLMSSLDWSNVGRSIDGGQITFAPEGWWITAFAGNVRESKFDVTAGTDGVNNDNWMYTLYASCRLVENHQFDGYLIFRDNKQGGPHATTPPNREDYTVGARFKGKTAGLKYTGELAWQSGQVYDPTRSTKTHINAWMTAWTLGYTLNITDDLKISFGGEYSYASGDKRGTDRATETFDPIYPFGHFYLGHMDQIAFKNVHSAKFMFKVAPSKALSFNLHAHSFWRARRGSSPGGGDVWYSVSDKTAQNGPTATSKGYIGWEVDLFVKYKLFDSLAFWGGYSHFGDGAAVRQSQNYAGGNGTDARDNMDWFFLQAEFTF